MAIQLLIWERRDGGDRVTMGNTALELCRIIRQTKGIISCRFYWSGPDELVFLSEGEAAALNTPDQATLADYTRFGFILADHARMIVNKRLIDPREGLQAYLTAGR